MSELRKDPIIDRWVIVATERSRRPTDFPPSIEPPTGAFSPFASGQEDKTPPEVAQIGRADDQPKDSPGWRVRVVPNKFPALSNSGDPDFRGHGMYDLMNGIGAHEVIIENPDQTWDMSNASSEEMFDVMTAYALRIRSLHEDPRYHYILVFRNKGVAAGATIAHPHSQLIALPFLPKQIIEKLDAARAYFKRKNRSIFSDMLRQELEENARVVEENEHFVVLSPFAARFPFELQIFPKRHNHDYSQQSEAELRVLGETLQRNLKRIKGALSDPSYNMMLSTSPSLLPLPGTEGRWATIASDFCWHIDILPRLTSVAGFEWGTGTYINPVAPEAATQFLRDVVI